jgi:twitching motility protein PilI
MNLEKHKAVDYANDALEEVLSQPEADTTMPEEAVFGIRIGSIGLLVSTTRFCEVLDKVQVNALPNVHPWVSGILNLRGSLVPVFDLRVVLEEAAGDNKKRRLFAVDRDEKAVALWIESFPEIKDRACMQPLTELPSLPKVLQRFVTGGYKQGGQVWLDVKFEDLFKVLGSHQYTMEEIAT